MANGSTDLNELAYRTPPMRRPWTIDDALGLVVVAAMVLMIPIAVMMGGLADWADDHPREMAIVDGAITVIFFCHVVAVAWRMRLSWKRKFLPPLLGFAAIIDALLLFCGLISLFSSKT